MSGYEHRRFPRVDLDVAAVLSFAGRASAQARVTSLSLVGLFAVDLEPMPVGSTCEAVIETAPKEMARIRGVVVRTEQNGVGVEITAIERESFQSLRELIVRKATNPFTCDTAIVANMARIPPWF